MKYLLVLFSGLEISDGVITDFFVRNGLVQESNSLMEPIIRDGNFLLLKIAGAIISGFIFWIIYKRFSRAVFIVVSSISVFYLLVIIWNLGVILRL